MNTQSDTNPYRAIGPTGGGRAVTARRLTGLPSVWHDIYKWVETRTDGSFDYTSDTRPGVGITIDPADGNMVLATRTGDEKAHHGDWIVQLAATDFTVVTDAEFRGNYTPITWEEPLEAGRLVTTTETCQICSDCDKPLAECDVSGVRPKGIHDTPHICLPLVDVQKAWADGWIDDITPARIYDRYQTDDCDPETHVSMLHLIAHHLPAPPAVWPSTPGSTARLDEPGGVSRWAININGRMWRLENAAAMTTEAIASLGYLPIHDAGKGNK